MKKKSLIFVGVLLILAYILFGIIFDGNHILMFPFTLTIVFLISIFKFKREEKINYLDLIIMIIPFELLFIISSVLVNDFSRTLQYIIFIPLAVSSAYLYLKFRKVYLIPTTIIFFGIMSYFLFNTIFIFLTNYDAEKNINFPSVDIVDKYGKKINFKKDKIIVLDFWSTSCGICYKKFPDFENLYNSFKSNEKVEIYTVNYPLKRDKFEETIKELDSLGYTFPKLYAKSAKEIEEKLHFNTFPHMLILKNGRIRYDGAFETKSNTLIYSTESEIEKLLKEY